MLEFVIRYTELLPERSRRRPRRVIHAVNAVLHAAYSTPVARKTADEAGNIAARVEEGHGTAAKQLVGANKHEMERGDHVCGPGKQLPYLCGPASWKQ